jgi:hypothetical protein
MSRGQMRAGLGSLHADTRGASSRGTRTIRRGTRAATPSVRAPECGQLDEGGLDGRHETPLERLDRNLQELLSELRVVVTGVQVLFAFLLVVPFNSGFVNIGPFERRVYFVTLLLAALAAVCMLAAPAHHRILFRCDDKRHIVFTANRLMITGLAFLALAMCGSLLLVATKLFGVTTGAITVALAALSFLIVWFVLPLVRKARLAGVSRGPGNGDGPQRGRAAELHGPRVK